MEFSTQRYKLTVTTLAEGGPGGYESRYLAAEGEPVSEALNGELTRRTQQLLPAINKSLRQRNGETLAAALETGKPVGIASGFKPSGAYHFGHKLTSGAVAALQKSGVQVFIPVADIECDMDTRLSREQYRRWAADNLLDWGANGVNLDAAHVYLQSEELRVGRLAYMVARGLQLEFALDIYGIDKLRSDFPFLFAGITQVGDILLPQHQDFGNHHSFMLSGPDQDGHMKMTTALTKACLEQGITLAGVQTTPSGLYIPHMRGISGDKASSSKAASTLYLGSGPDEENLEKRTQTCLRKIDAAQPEQLALCALDMVRYLGEFTVHSVVDFGTLVAEPEYQRLTTELNQAKDQAGQTHAQAAIDSFLNRRCSDAGQDNRALLRAALPEILAEHRSRRAIVLAYAVALAEGKEAATPPFWTVPAAAVVDPNQRRETPWYVLVAQSAGGLLP